VVNENEVERLLEEFNFEVVDLVNLSLIQIKEIFASAKIILSPLSSGLLNIFYSPEKTYVGVIVGQVFNEKYLAGAFAQLGNDIEFIQAKHLNQHRHSDVIVSLGSLRKAVDLILTKEKV
jgi:capsular polysaccharide biosynthesis protein